MLLKLYAKIKQGRINDRFVKIKSNIKDNKEIFRLTKKEFSKFNIQQKEELLKYACENFNKEAIEFFYKNGVRVVNEPNERLSFLHDNGIKVSNESIKTPLLYFVTRKFKEHIPNKSLRITTYEVLDPDKRLDSEFILMTYKFKIGISSKHEMIEILSNTEGFDECKANDLTGKYLSIIKRLIQIDKDIIEEPDSLGYKFIHYLVSEGLIGVIIDEIDLTQAFANALNDKYIFTCISTAIENKDLVSFAALFKLGANLYLTPEGKSSLKKFLKAFESCIQDNNSACSYVPILLEGLQDRIGKDKESPWKLKATLKNYQTYIKPFAESVIEILEKAKTYGYYISCQKYQNNNVDTIDSDIHNLRVAKHHIDKFICDNLLQIEAITKNSITGLPIDVVKYICSYLNLNDITLRSQTHHQNKTLDNNVHDNYEIQDYNIQLNGEADLI